MKIPYSRRKPILKFMVLTTFGFGGSMCLGLALWYVAELVLLWLNPIDVMSVTPARYYVFEALSTNAKQMWARELWYDVACWLTDHKKFFSYPVMAFWLQLFARVISKPSEFAQFRRASYGQKRRLARLVAGANQRLKSNAIIAFFLLFLASPAAMSPLGLFEPGAHSLFSAAPWNDSIYANAYYLAYRIANPLVVWIVLVHLITAVRCLKAHATRVDQRISGFFVATLVFSLFAILAHLVAAKMSLEELGYSFLKGNFPSYMLAIGLFVVVLYLLYLYQDPDPKAEHESLAARIWAIVTGFWRALTNPQDASTELKQVIRELPVFAILPLLGILFPSIWVLLAGALGSDPRSTRDQLYDPRLRAYVDDLYYYSRFECPAEIRGHTRAGLMLDWQARSETVRRRKPTTSSSPSSQTESQPTTRAVEVEAAEFDVSSVSLQDLLKSYPDFLSAAKDSIAADYARMRNRAYKRR